MDVEELPPTALRNSVFGQPYHDEPRLIGYFRCVAAAWPQNKQRVCPEALCDNSLAWPGLKRLCAP